VQGHHVQPVVQVLPERALPHHLPEVAVGGGHDAAVHAHRPAAAHPLHHPLLQHPQQLHLHAGRHVAHLVQKQRPSGGLFELPGPGVEGVGVSPLLVPEQLRLQEGLRHRPTVEDHERPTGPAALQVDGPRHQLLSGPRLPREQDRGVRGCHDGRDPQHLVHGRGVAHHPLEPVGAGQVLLQLPLPVPLRPHAGQVPDSPRRGLHPVRGRHHVRGPGPHCFHHLRHRGDSQGHHHGDCGPRGPQGSHLLHAGGHHRAHAFCSAAVLRGGVGHPEPLPFQKRGQVLEGLPHRGHEQDRAARGARGRGKT
jgi:hypothetical protein